MDWLQQFWIFDRVIAPVLDVLILSFIIYQVYKLFIQTRAVQLLKGALFIAVLYALAFFLQLETLQWIMSSLATILVIIIAVVFQPELRNIFTRIGQRNWFSFSAGTPSYKLDAVINAAEVLSGRRRGALIVFARKVGIKAVIETGTRLNADLSSSLLLTIFSYDTVLHDGAVVIHEGRVAAAGCVLPLSDQTDIKRSFGTRHRAALGLAEETDAVVLVVSEETGSMSLAYDADLHYDISTDTVLKTLKKLLDFREEEKVEEDLSFED